MRVGKKPNFVEVKKTRACVVRLEKVTTTPNVSPSPEENRNVIRTNRLIATVMGANSKARKGGTAHQEDKAITGSTRKKITDGTISVHSSFQTPQQQKGTSINMSNIRSNQKVNIIPKSNKISSPSASSREETPPPTIAAGRSRRAIKPNPKYASEDIVTPKVLRNVGMLTSSASRGGQNKTRKASTSSDDFYNRNSEDEYENYVTNVANDDDNYEEMQNDNDDHDSDFSVVDDAPSRSSRTRARQRRIQEYIQPITQQTDRLTTQTPNIKRTPTTVAANLSNLRSAPSQLQQIRRSLASANAQRNLNMLVGNSNASQKRKLEEVQDASDNESSYSIKRKQLSPSSEIKVKSPIRENRFNVSSTPFLKSRLISQPQIYRAQYQQPINGSNKTNNVLSTSRRSNEIAAKSNSESFAKSSVRQSATNVNQNNKSHNLNPITTQTKILGSKPPRFQSGSPKPALPKEKQNHKAAISISSSSSSSSSLNNNSKRNDNTKANSTQSTIKSRTTTSTHNSIAISSENIHEIKDDSPNSTIDDFETMPTFTIVNVNDIINKKGDVLITKSNSNKTPTVIELSESISLDDDDEDTNKNINDDIEEVEAVVNTSTRPTQMLSKKVPKLPTLNNRKESEKKPPLLCSNESSRKLSTQVLASTRSSNQAPQILNHKLGLRNSRVAAKTTTTLTTTLTSSDKPAPRILNSVVAKKTQPVKPMIANMDDSADESFPLSLDEDDDEEEETENEIESRNRKVTHVSGKTKKREYQNLMEVDTEDTESQNTEEDDIVLQTSKNISSSKVTALPHTQNTGPQRRRRAAGISNTPIIVSSNQKRLTPAPAKENSLAATNQQVIDTTTKQAIASTLPARKSNTEKVVISKQGDKIIKKITCFETWYVINTPVETKRPANMKNQLEMPLIRLANHAKDICLPNNMWSSKVTLYELSPQTLAKGTFATYTGDLYEHNISEEDRGKYQPSCVMFRRSIAKNHASRMPYDRAVIFKNKTFYTNIEGKNVRLIGAPSIINSESEVEILLEVVDSLTLQSEFIEHISIVQ